MKLGCSNGRDCGLTLVELLVVVFSFAVLKVLLLPLLASTRIDSNRLSCTNNLKETSLAFQIWKGDYGDLFPMAVSCTNGGAMEQAATGNVAAVFQVMSNELSTPRILVCPEDTDH